jgi:hypothetical protein
MDVAASNGGITFGHVPDQLEWTITIIAALHLEASEDSMLLVIQHVLLV